MIVIEVIGMLLGGLIMTFMPEPEVRPEPTPEEQTVIDERNEEGAARAKRAGAEAMERAKREHEQTEAGRTNRGQTP